MPSSDSAPFWSRITRESVCEETANAIRDGTLALIMPVMTSTRGDCVASTRWMPTARAFWAIRMIESSTSAGRDHHQVRELVDHAQDVRQRRLVAAGADAVEVLQRARARQRHVRVALLHLAHEVLERDRGLLGRGDHRRQQVRDRVVVRQLDLLGVHEHHPHLVRRGLQQDRREHRVDRARLARAGRAGDQQVRHLGQVGADRAARDVLAEPDGERRPVRRAAGWKTSPRCTIRRRAFGTSMPTACLPGIGARMRMSAAASAYARSSLSCATLPTLMPGASRSS